MNVQLNKFLIIYLVVTGLVIGLSAYLVIFPLLRSINSTKVENQTRIDALTDYQNQLASLTTLKDKSANLPPLSDNQSSFASYVAMARNLVPQDPDLDNFVIQLESLLDNVQLTDANFEISDLTSQSGAAKSSSVLTDVQGHSFSIIGTTSFSKISNLLNVLKTINRLTETTSISISAGTDANSLAFEIHGNVFSRTKSADQSQIKINPNTIFTQAAQSFTTYSIMGQPIDITKVNTFGRSNPFLPNK